MTNNFTIELPFGTNDYGNIFDSDRKFIGNVRGLTFGKKIGVGRPGLADGNRVAGYLAYWLGRDADMNNLEARDFAISATQYGAGIIQNRRQSFKKRLDDEKTNNLVKNKTRVTVHEDENPSVATSLLLAEGFRHYDEAGRMHIQGDGWLWQPSQKSAIFGTIAYSSPVGFKYLNEDEPP